MLAWHFLPTNRRLRYGDNRIVQAGKTYRIRSGFPILYANGMHGSERIIDALKWANGPIVCRVDITEDLMQERDKIVGRELKVLWMLDATGILHEFACRCAEDALALIDNPDPRSIAAIQAKRDWMAGRIETANAVRYASAAGAVRDVEGTGAANAARYASAVKPKWAASAVKTKWVASAARYARIASGAGAESKQNRRLTAMVCAAHRKEQ